MEKRMYLFQISNYDDPAVDREAPVSAFKRLLRFLLPVNIGVAKKPFATLENLRGERLSALGSLSERQPPALLVEKKML